MITFRHGAGVTEKRTIWLGMRRRHMFSSVYVCHTYVENRACMIAVVNELWSRKDL